MRDAAELASDPGLCMGSDGGRASALAQQRSEPSPAPVTSSLELLGAASGGGLVRELLSAEVALSGGPETHHCLNAEDGLKRHKVLEPDKCR